MRFLGLGLQDLVPDAQTVWRYREALAQAGRVKALFKQFDGYLTRQGYIARGGQNLDASIVPVLHKHNTRDENAAIRMGRLPDGWEGKPAIPVRIYGPPGPALPAADRDGHCTQQVPFVSCCGPAAPDAVGKKATKAVHPLPEGFLAEGAVAQIS